jgi:hypothetical protein
MVGQQYIKPANVFLTCCPWWLASQPAVNEVAQAASWAENGGVGDWCGGVMTVALRNAVSAFRQGLYEAYDERHAEDKKRRARDGNS